MSLSFLLLLLFAVDERFPFLSTTTTTTMNTTYDEPSELSSPKTNMAPTTTFAKSKKGVVVLVALCVMFFYTGRLSSSRGGGGASLNASLLRGFQQDVARVDADDIDPCAEIARIVDLCKPWWKRCFYDSVCHSLLSKVNNKCGCDSDFSCIDNTVTNFGIVGNKASSDFFLCIYFNWDNPSSTPVDPSYVF